MPESRPVSSTMGETRRELTALFSFFTRPASVAALASGVALLLTAEVVAVAHLQRLIVDALLARERAMILESGLWLVSVAVLRAALVAWWRFRRVSYSGELAGNLQKALARRAMSLGTEEAERMDRGVFSSWATSDVRRAAQVLDPTFQSLQCVLQAAAATVFMVRLDWRLGGLTAISVPLITWIGNRLSSPMADLARRVQDSYARISSFVTDIIANRQVVAVFGLQTSLGRRFRSLNEDAYAANQKAIRRAALLEGFTWFFAAAPLAVPFVYGGYLAFRGLVTAGTVMAIVNLSNCTRAPVAQLGGQLGRIRRCLGSAREAVRFVRTRPGREVLAHCSGCSISGDGALSFGRLSFRYPGSSRPVLQGISFSTPPASWTAVVGESGSGKTTLLKVIAGLYRVQPDEAPAETTPRPVVTYVPQEPFLFPWSIRENLLLGAAPDGRDGPGEGPAEELGEALRAACAEFALALPRGPDTAVSDGAGSLSGGEKARLAIARALLTRPDVLILDEPGASLDGRTEQLLWERLRSFMAGSSVIVATHRLAGLRASDTVIFLGEGRVVGAGRHENLLKACEPYEAVYRRSLKVEGETDAPV